MPSATSTLTTAPAAIPPPAPAELRLQLDPTMAGTGAVDGGWWPRSRDPDAELPGLIAGLGSCSSLGPITRVARNLDTWDTAPRRVALLVVPPQATTAAAGVAMAMAADAASSAGPADILAAAGAGGEDPDPNAPGHSG
jgi:hypothetical protein